MGLELERRCGVLSIDPLSLSFFALMITDYLWTIIPPMAVVNLTFATVGALGYAATTMAAILPIPNVSTLKHRTVLIDYAMTRDRSTINFLN
jgi:hypothetical protein